MSLDHLNVIGGFCEPRWKVIAIDNLHLAYSYMQTTLIACTPYEMEHLHILHTLFSFQETFPNSDWKEGFQWVATADSDTDGFLPVR
jgi:hypothetical protein